MGSEPPKPKEPEKTLKGNQFIKFRTSKRVYQRNWKDEKRVPALNLQT
jgi:hypothetical protein